MSQKGPTYSYDRRRFWLSKNRIWTSGVGGSMNFLLLLCPATFFPLRRVWWKSRNWMRSIDNYLLWRVAPSSILTEFNLNFFFFSISSCVGSTLNVPKYSIENNCYNKYKNLFVFFQKSILSSWVTRKNLKIEWPIGWWRDLKNVFSLSASFELSTLDRLLEENDPLTQKFKI